MDAGHGARSRLAPTAAPGDDPPVSRKPKTARAERRARGRTHEALVRDLERLAALRPGAAPGRPLAVASPAQIEVIASGAACPLCDGTLALEEHVAEVVDGQPLRAAHVRCARCGVRRTLWFRIGVALH